MIRGLKQHLGEKTPISELRDEYALQPSQIYYWQTQFFEHGAGVSERKTGPQGPQDLVPQDAIPDLLTLGARKSNSR